ncbi:hypothetical protein AKJ65_01345 [candidate division MSBL1 archaeon SCGC-AAA259E19]|uniref:Uncharacterized protein n=1 Tax=candidate division MSBL1 archaeon SCGC-AAA259E19 TaxID=1698264 RepID=A0A133UND8_9EURY|nr:hypothetical protein AKJ65_01345 [candidate division MSBL1 archaeon SCGC-AAA259E19]
MKFYLTSFEPEKATSKKALKLIFMFLGAACALIGLAEVSRLVVLRALSAGESTKLYLELGVYAIGVVWILYNFSEEIKDELGCTTFSTRFIL